MTASGSPQAAMTATIARWCAVAAGVAPTPLRPGLTWLELALKAALSVQAGGPGAGAANLFSHAQLAAMTTALSAMSPPPGRSPANTDEAQRLRAFAELAGLLSRHAGIAAAALRARLAAEPVQSGDSVFSVCREEVGAIHRQLLEDESFSEAVHRLLHDWSPAPGTAGAEDAEPDLNAETVSSLKGARLLRLTAAGVSTGPPLLVVPGPHQNLALFDAHGGDTLVGGLAARGHEIHLLQWTRPSASNAALSSLVDGALGGALDTLSSASGGPADVLGVSLGGTLALCAAAVAPQRLRRLVLLGTPVDFDVPGFALARWARAQGTQALVSRVGGLPGLLLDAVTLALAPLARPSLVERMGSPELMSGATVDALLCTHRDVDARTFRVLHRAFFDANALIAGDARIGRRRLRIESVAAPVLSIHARDDHLVPASSSAALKGLLAPDRCTGVTLDAGHAALYDGADALVTRIGEWLQATPPGHGQGP